jgi:hypothetical protein
MTRPLAEALESRYPYLTGGQRGRLETVLLCELATAISQGEGIGIIRLLPDGSFEIKRFAVLDANGEQ